MTLSARNRIEGKMVEIQFGDHTALTAKVGPFRLVAPHEKRPARWVRMLKSLTVIVAAPGKPD